MTSLDDRLAICLALQRMSKFTPAELAMSSGRPLRVIQSFLQEASDLVVNDLPSGHDKRRPKREYWSSATDREILNREIAALRRESHLFRPVGTLFDGIDRLLRDVAKGEVELALAPISDDEKNIEQEHQVAQRRTIERSLVDIEVDVTRALNARRIANTSHAYTMASQPVIYLASSQWSRDWFERHGASLLDWGVPTQGIFGRAIDQQSKGPEVAHHVGISEALRLLTIATQFDDISMGTIITTLRHIRQTWAGPQSFGETLNEEFRHILRKMFGRQLIGPLAVVAALLGETPCAQSLFEGWLLLIGDRTQSHIDSNLVATALARLSFEAHSRNSVDWKSSSAASMCQYIAAMDISPTGLVAAVTGGILSESPDIDYFLALFIKNYDQLSSEADARVAKAASRSLLIALFLRGSRQTPTKPIPSLPKYPGGESFLHSLLNSQYGVIVPRATRQKYEFRPGRGIEFALAEKLGIEGVTLEMPVTLEFERSLVIAGTASRWDGSGQSNSSFTGDLENYRALRH